MPFDVRSAAYVAGLVLGSVMLLGTMYMWIRHRQFGIAGGVFCAVGVVLVGLGIYTKVQISGGADGIKIDVERLTKRVDSLSRRDSLTASSVSRLAVRLDSSVALPRSVSAYIADDLLSDATLAKIRAQQATIEALAARVEAQSQHVDALGKSVVEHQANFRRFVDQQARANESMTKQLEATTILMKRPEATTLLMKKPE